MNEDERYKQALSEYLKPEINQAKNLDIPQMPVDFKKKRKIGENDSEICKIIRNDLINEFIFYFEKNKKINNKGFEDSINKVPISIFETNKALLQSSLLGYAAFYGSLKIFNYLLEVNDANRILKKTDHDKKYLWEYAIRGNQLEIIHILEEKEILSKLFLYIKDFFNLAVECHHYEIARYISNNYKLYTNYLSALEYSNFAFIDDFYNGILDIGHVLIYNLCLHNFPRFAQVFIESKNIDFESLPNVKQIAKASVQSNNDFLIYLAEKYPNLEFENASLFDAISNENISILNIILQKISAKSINTIVYKKYTLGKEQLCRFSPLVFAVIKQNIEMVKLLLNHPSIDINLCFEPTSGRTTQRTALHFAVMIENVPIVKLLLDQPSINLNILGNIDETTYKFTEWSNMNHFDQYYTPLHVAIELENVEIVKLLLEQPNIYVNAFEVIDFYSERFKNSFNRIFQTALCRAIQKKNSEIVKLLLDHPNIKVNKFSIFKTNCRRNAYYNPETIVDDNEEEETEEEQNNEKNKIIKRSPLQFAYESNSKDIVQLLLNRDDLKCKDLNEEKNDSLIKMFTMYINVLH